MKYLGMVKSSASDWIEIQMMKNNLSKSFSEKIISHDKDTYKLK